MLSNDVESRQVMMQLRSALLFSLRTEVVLLAALWIGVGLFAGLPTEWQPEAPAPSVGVDRDTRRPWTDPPVVSQADPGSGSWLDPDDSFDVTATSTAVPLTGDLGPELALTLDADGTTTREPSTPATDEPLQRDIMGAGQGQPPELRTTPVEISSLPSVAVVPPRLGSQDRDRADDAIGSKTPAPAASRDIGEADSPATSASGRSLKTDEDRRPGRRRPSPTRQAARHPTIAPTPVQERPASRPALGESPTIASQTSPTRRPIVQLPTRLLPSDLVEANAY
jgi:hypothetical protein